MGKTAEEKWARVLAYHKKIADDRAKLDPAALEVAAEALFEAEMQWDTSFERATWDREKSPQEHYRDMASITITAYNSRPLIREG